MDVSGMVSLCMTNTEHFFLKGCINCYARDTMNPVKGKTMHDLHQATVENTEYLKRQGYNVVEVWECAIKRELASDEDMKYYFEPMMLLIRWSLAMLCTNQCSEAL